MDALSSTLLPFASESLQRTGDNSGADEHRHHAAARIDVAFIEWQVRKFRLTQTKPQYYAFWF